MEASVLNRADSRLELTLIVPRSDGVLSGIDWRIKLSEDPSTTHSWTSIPKEKWIAKSGTGFTPGMEFTLVVDTLAATSYDFEVRARSVEALNAGNSTKLTVNTLAVREQISDEYLKQAAGELRRILDEGMRTNGTVTPDSIKQLRLILSTLESSIVTVPMLKNKKINMRKAIKDVADGARHLVLPEDEMFKSELKKRANDLEAQWKTIGRSEPQAPTLAVSFSELTLTLDVTVPEASTEITNFEVEWTLSGGSAQHHAKFLIPRTAWESTQTHAQFQYAWYDARLQPGTTCTVRVCAHGTVDCWKERGHWSVEALVSPQAPLEGSLMACAGDIQIKDASAAFQKAILRLSDELGREPSSLGLEEDSSQIDSFEAYEGWTVKLVREASILTYLSRLLRLDLSHLVDADASKMERVRDRARVLDSRCKTLFKTPPAKIGEKPLLAAASKHSLKLSVVVPAASTDITAYEVQVIMLVSKTKSPSRWIPKEAWQVEGKPMAAGETVEWLLDGLEEGTQYIVAVRAHGTEDCSSRTKHWSPVADLRTDGGVPELSMRGEGAAEDAEGAAEEEARRQQEKMYSDALSMEAAAEYAEAAAEEAAGDEADGDAPVEDGHSPTKAKARLSGSTFLKSCAIFAAKEVYTEKQDLLCSAIRKASLVRQVAATLGQACEPELLGAMELAMLFDGSGKALCELAVDELKLPDDYLPIAQCQACAPTHFPRVRV